MRKKSFSFFCSCRGRDGGEKKAEIEGGGASRRILPLLIQFEVGY
jgi:hypothetical protein